MNFKKSLPLIRTKWIKNFPNKMNYFSNENFGSKMGLNGLSFNV